MTFNYYYPFGSLMHERSWQAASTENYRFGFNGQEKENEISGLDGGHLVFEYRINDTRLGRFLSVDPLDAEYPWNSPYAFAENKPIIGIDLEGCELMPVNSSMYRHKYYNSTRILKPSFDGNGFLITLTKTVHKYDVLLVEHNVPAWGEFSLILNNAGAYGENQNDHNLPIYSPSDDYISWDVGYDPEYDDGESNIKRVATNRLIKYTRKNREIRTQKQGYASGDGLIVLIDFYIGFKEFLHHTRINSANDLILKNQWHLNNAVLFVETEMIGILKDKPQFQEGAGKSAMINYILDGTIQSDASFTKDDLVNLGNQIMSKYKIEIRNDERCIKNATFEMEQQTLDNLFGEQPICK